MIYCSRIAIGAAALIAAIASPAIGQDADRILVDREGAVARVSFADLDLSTEAGARILQARLRRAVRRACHIESVRQSWDYQSMVACKRRTARLADVDYRRVMAGMEPMRVADRVAAGGR